MKKVSVVVFIATIAFLIVTASSASIGKEYSYRQDIFGWPNKFFTVTYEKAKITNLEIDTQNILLNYFLCLAGVGGIRLMFLFMKVKRAPLQRSRSNSISPVKSTSF